MYRQGDEEWLKEALQKFSLEQGILHPEVIKSWERELPCLIMYLRYPEEIRAYVYTTNTLERRPETCEFVLKLGAQN
jgi:transposase-like protein